MQMRMAKYANDDSGFLSLTHLDDNISKASSLTIMSKIKKTSAKQNQKKWCIQI